MRAGSRFSAHRQSAPPNERTRPFFPPLDRCFGPLCSIVLSFSRLGAAAPLSLLLAMGPHILRCSAQRGRPRRISNPVLAGPLQSLHLHFLLRYKGGVSVRRQELRDSASKQFGDDSYVLSLDLKRRSSTASRLVVNPSHPQADSRLAADLPHRIKVSRKCLGSCSSVTVLSALISLLNEGSCRGMMSCQSVARSRRARNERGRERSSQGEEGKGGGDEKKADENWLESTKEGGWGEVEGYRRLWGSTRRMK